MIEIDTYRVRRRHLIELPDWVWIRVGPDCRLAAWLTRSRYPFWQRTWQAEWNGCERAPRAFTEAGVLRRARRWIALGNG